MRFSWRKIVNCPHCGSDLPPVSDAFCPSCRESLDESDCVLPIAESLRPTISPPGIRADILTALVESHRSSPTVANYFRKSIRVHLILVALCGGAAGLFWSEGSDEAALAFLGILFGSLLRDYAWFRASVKLWPTINALMDWERIEQVLEESKADSKPIN